MRLSNYALLLLLAAPMFAQSASSPETSSMVLHSHTQMVYLPVLVRDKHGAPVRGLKAEQFHVMQDGREHKLDVFEEVSAESQSDEAKKLGHSMTADGYVYNIGATAVAPQRMVIMLIDNLNGSYLNQARSRKAILNFLKKELPSDQPVSLLMFNYDGLRQVHPFTTDSKVLAAALEHSVSAIGMMEGLAKLSTNDGQAPSTLPSPGGTTPLSNSSMQAASQAEATALELWATDVDAKINMLIEKQKIWRTMSALQQLAGAYAGIPGRKTLVWLTTGLPLQLDDPDSLTGWNNDMVDLYRSTWRLLESANIAVYPVDVEGLTISATYQSSNSGNWQTSNNAVALNGMKNEAASVSYNQPASSHAAYNPKRSNIDTMESFAQATGGHARYYTNDVEGAMAEAAHESGAYYMVGYYLPSDAKPGWRKLKVRVDGSGFTVRARDGFFAGDTPEAGNQKQIMRTAINSPIDYTGLRFAARIQETTAGAQADLKNVPLKLVIPFESVKVDEHSGDAIDVSFAYMAVDKQGVIRKAQSGEVKTQLSREQVAEMKKRGMLLNAALELKPADYTLRIVVRDNLTGKIGSIQLSLEAKNFSSKLASTIQ